MSFRTRLTSFFVVIVMLPMVAVGFLVFRLISQSEQGKADARANGLATAAASVYESESASARADAAALAHAVGRLGPAGLRPRVAELATQAGLERVTITSGARVLVDVGARTAVAPAMATVRRAGAPVRTVTVSEVTAAAYARKLLAPGVGIVVQAGGRTLAAEPPAAGHAILPRRGTLKVAGTGYRVLTQRFRGFAAPVKVAVLSSLSATASSLRTSRLLAAGFIVAFVFLALAFSILASRALAGQIGGFLQAARRLAAGDFSSPVPTRGHDEFAALGEEFNRMSDQLARRIDELAEERGRLRESIHRIGETFASNLDRQALLNLALTTSLDAVHATAGRLTARGAGHEPLAEFARVGSLDEVGDQVLAAEREVLRGGELGEASHDGWHVAAVALRPLRHGERTHAVITVARRDQPFSDNDRDVLRSLGSQATLALENVNLHFQVQRQAITDELTGLTNHGPFQELLSDEVEQVRRYHQSLGLIMLDIDDFKAINDTYGHQQGDLVLKQVARALRDSSREVDVPARYGGEEMALILPHTDLDGAHAIAERVRTAVAELRIPRLDGEGQLRITASAGVAASSEGDRDALIAEADSALYAAKRQGKNRTIRAQPQTANVFGPQ
jgi:diguanylate cyclase (GGDEF)-like protein